MDLNDDALAAQRRYARLLAWGTGVGLVLLAIGFVTYVTGLVTPHVTIEKLPQLWGRPAAELLAHSGVSTGWGWGEFIHRGDMLVLAAIALLASCSLPCLAAVIPIFAKRGEHAFVAICILEIAVLALAISGVLSAIH
jgi:hypothetical protein